MMRPNHMEAECFFEPVCCSHCLCSLNCFVLKSMAGKKMCFAWCLIQVIVCLKSEEFFLLACRCDIRPNGTRIAPGVETNSTVSSETAFKCRLESVPNGDHCFPVIESNLPPILPKNKKIKRLNNSVASGGTMWNCRSWKWKPLSFWCLKMVLRCSAPKPSPQMKGSDLVFVVASS